MTQRRDLFKLAGAGALAAAGTSALAQAVTQATPASSAAAPKNPHERPALTEAVDRKLDVANIDYLEAEARKVWGEGVYVFVAHGAGEQWTLRENRRAFGDHAFAPRRLTGTVASGIDTSIDLLGVKSPHPIIVTPMGSHGLSHPLGEVATVRGAAATGGIFTLSGASTRSLEDVAAAADNAKWFQVYLHPDLGISRAQLQRARAAGYKAVVFTVDAIGQGQSDAYIHMGKPRPPLPYGNYANTPVAFKTDLSWKDIDFIREASGLPVIVKGITRAEDALAALDHGASAIQVSNHGGRALDGTPAAITVLPQVAAAVKGRAPIIMDSGIRRGTDVAKALALGASAVAIGRPVHYGLVLGGASGVQSVIEFMRRELVNTMLHLGVRRIADLKPELLVASASRG